MYTGSLRHVAAAAYLLGYFGPTQRLGDWLGSPLTEEDFEPINDAMAQLANAKPMTRRARPMHTKGAR